MYSSSFIPPEYPNRKHYASDFVSDLVSRNNSMNKYKYFMQNNIRKYRNEAGLSQQALADRIGNGTTKGTISKLEKDEMAFTTDWIKKIATALDLSNPSLLIDDSKQKSDDGYEMAILFALKEIINILLGRTKPTEKNLIDHFGYALESYRAMNSPDAPNAISVMDELLAHIRDGKPLSREQAIRKMRELSPPIS